jgi:hypothetical protein
MREEKRRFFEALLAARFRLRGYAAASSGRELLAARFILRGSSVKKSFLRAFLQKSAAYLTARANV